MPRKNLDKLLLIIDGSNLAHRAYNKFMGFKDYKGRNTGLIYGFLKILQTYVIRFHPKYLIITFDTKESKESNFRNELLGSYKIHRTNLRIDIEDFNQQLTVLKKILKYLNIPIVSDNQGLGHESDDYIGYFALEHSKWHSKVTIVSSDKDFCQLISGDIKIFNPFKDTLISKHNCQDVMGYSPNECVDYLCLVGDKSDDIPGYKGIGEKRARAFLDEFGSIQSFLDDSSATFKGIDRDGLEDLYKRNKELIDINIALKNHPLKEVPILYHRTNRIAKKRLENIFNEYKFRSFLEPSFIQTFKTLKQWKPKE